MEKKILKDEELKRLIALRLRKLCDKYDISQKRLSEATGIHVNTINSYFNAKTMPSLYNIYLISRAFGLTVSQLIGE